VVSLSLESFHSLVLTNIASAWTIAAPMLVREKTLIIMTVEELRRELPFPLLGMDVDNDSAFINSTLLGYCKERELNSRDPVLTKRMTRRGSSRRTGRWSAE
jgi:hypothetical protein